MCRVDPFPQRWQHFVFEFYRDDPFDSRNACITSGAGICTSSSVFALTVSSDGVFHFGNLGRNALIGPAFRDTDLSIIKNVRLAGQTRVQLRVEAFNIFVKLLY